MGTAEEKADRIIKGLVATAMTMAVIPAPLGVPFMAAVATGVVAIGRAYGVQVGKDEGWKLVREFFRAAGLTFMAINVGGLFASTIVNLTGAGYPVAVALDAAQGSAVAYAVGHAAKHYFSRQQDQREMSRALRAELGSVMRNRFRQGREAARHGGLEDLDARVPG